MSESKKSSSSGLFSNAISLFGSLEGAKPSAKPENNVDEIPREELLTLCMKLNKRMQLLEGKNQEITKRFKSVIQERNMLIDLIQVSLSNPIVVDDKEALNIELLKDSWLHEANHQKNQLQTLQETIIKQANDHQIEISGLQGRIKQMLNVSMTSSNQLDDSITKSDVVDSEIKFLKEDILMKGITCNEMKAEIEKISQARTVLKQEVERYRIDLDHMRTKMLIGEELSSEKNKRIQELEQLYEEQKAGREEDVVFHQLQLKSLKAKEEERERLKNECMELRSELNNMQQQNLTLTQSLDQSNDNVLVLNGKSDGLMQELERVKGRLREFEKNSAASTVLKAQQEAVLSGLKKDLNSANHHNIELQAKLKELEESKHRYENTLSRNQEDKNRLLTLEAQLEESTSLCSRLRSQLQTSESNYALRTAMLATVEAQLAAVQDTIKNKESAVAEAVERVTILQARLSDAEFRIEERVKESNARIESLQREIDDVKLSCDVKLKESKHENTVMIENMQQEHSKKSNAARMMLSERDEEIRILQLKVDELKEEIASGAPSERKIFELAQSQAKRDATIGTNRDTRELAFQQLQSVLASKDLELAKLQQRFTELISELNELRRVSKREGVNIDYLKNIVIQYMSFPPTSSERNALVPVLAMLLQFSKAELKSVEEASRSTSWAARPVKELKLHPTEVLMSASVHASSPATQPAVFDQSKVQQGISYDNYMLQFGPNRNQQQGQANGIEKDKIIAPVDVRNSINAMQNGSNLVADSPLILNINVPNKGIYELQHNEV